MPQELHFVVSFSVEPSISSLVTLETECNLLVMCFISHSYHFVNCMNLNAPLGTLLHHHRLQPCHMHCFFPWPSWGAPTHSLVWSTRHKNNQQRFSRETEMSSLHKFFCFFHLLLLLYRLLQGVNGRDVGCTTVRLPLLALFHISHPLWHQWLHSSTCIFLQTGLHLHTMDRTCHGLFLSSNPLWCPYHTCQ